MKWVPRHPGTMLGVLLDYSGFLKSGLYVKTDERRPKRILLVLSTRLCDGIASGDIVTFDDGMEERLRDGDYEWIVLSQKDVLTVTHANDSSESK